MRRQKDRTYSYVSYMFGQTYYMFTKCQMKGYSDEMQLSYYRTRPPLKLTFLAPKGTEYGVQEYENTNMWAQKKKKKKNKKTKKQIVSLIVTVCATNGIFF